MLDKIPQLPPVKGRFYRHLPNLLTLLRLIIAPLTYVLIIKRQFEYAFLCFLFAGLSDIIDGYLARRWDAVSKIGSIMDPIADKVLIFITFITLGYLGIIPLWLVILVISRDILIILFGIITFICKLRIKLYPSWISKLNTFFQITLVSVVLLEQTSMYQKIIIGLNQNWLLNGLIIITTITTFWSGIQYLLYFTKRLYFLRKERKNAQK